MSAQNNIVGMLLALAWLGAGAQTLVDPTRPPPEASLSAGQLETPAASAGPRLQSVLIGTHGREVAVIDGETVRRGEKFHGAVLVHVGKNQVILQKGRDKQVLTLFPDVEKNAAVTAIQR